MSTTTTQHHEVSLGDRKANVEPLGRRHVLSLQVGADVLAAITLGVEVEGVDLGAGAEIVDSHAREVNEVYTAYLGKSVGEKFVSHKELTVNLRTGPKTWRLVVRVAPDGFAFRYGLPDDATTLGDEFTQFSPHVDARVWVLDYQTWYETPRFGADLAALNPGDYGFPILIGHRGQYLLVTESDIDGLSSGAHALFQGGVMHIVTADSSTSVSEGHHTPWRTIVAGSLAQIVSSTLVDDLAPAGDATPLVPRPGRAAWSWWSSQYSGAYLDVQKRFTDFAAEQGWEHVLVDCGWDAAWVPELVSYASARGIQVHLWSAWRDLDGAENLRKLALWRSWGVAGIKVDFMESESQARYQWYDAIIAETARVGLAVNFHGSVIPRGWNRTHPHVMSYEGIRGAEYYVFYGQPLTAIHNVIQPFTRNVVGSMDYTPVTFSAPQRETTEAHELALAVVFESGITHFADDPDEYRARPPAAQFLAEVPAIWDETRLLAGHPDTYAVMARRSGDRWFIGCISALDEVVTIDIDPVALSGSGAQAWTVTDDNAALLSRDIEKLDRTLSFDVQPRGGFVSVLAPADARPCRRARATEPVDVPNADKRLAILVDNSITFRTDATHVRVPDGWSATPNDGGTWHVQAPETDLQVGLATLTLEATGHGSVPAVSHIRVVTPLVDGPHLVSSLPFVDARNAIGPVERNLANGGGDPNDGAPLTVKGQVFSHGLGVCQESLVTFAVAGTMRRLNGWVGVDQETADADARADILVDNLVVATFTLQGGADPSPFSVTIEGATLVTLRTTPAHAKEAHIDWLSLTLSE